MDDKKKIDFAISAFAMAIVINTVFYMFIGGALAALIYYIMAH